MLCPDRVFILARITGDPGDVQTPLRIHVLEAISSPLEARRRWRLAIATNEGSALVLFAVNAPSETECMAFSGLEHCGPLAQMRDAGKSTAPSECMWRMMLRAAECALRDTEPETFDLGAEPPREEDCNG